MQLNVGEAKHREQCDLASKSHSTMRVKLYCGETNTRS